MCAFSARLTGLQPSEFRAYCWHLDPHQPPTTIEKNWYQMLQVPPKIDLYLKKRLMLERKFLMTWALS